MNLKHYTYRVTWSEEDQESVGLCVEFPSLSWLDPDPGEALRGIMNVVAEAVADMRSNGETTPEPLAEPRHINANLPSGFPKRRLGLCNLIGAGALALGAQVWAATPIQQGRTIATSGAGAAPACASCHGAQGQGMAAAGFPYLAGQGAGYLAAQLRGFATGKRINPVMEPIAKALNDQQIEAVAAYFSQLPPTIDVKALSAHIDSYPPANDQGAWLANRGDWDRNIPACIQCHGPGGVGVGGDFPAIAGLPARYIHAQLTAWKAKERDPGPMALMGDIASRMTDAQMTAVSDYFSGLPRAVADAAKKAEGSVQ